MFDLRIFIVTGVYYWYYIFFRKIVNIYSDDVVEDVVQHGDNSDSTEADLKADSAHGTES